MVNHSDIKSYSINKSLRKSLDTIGLKDKKSFPLVLDFIKEKYKYLVRYDQEDTGFVGVIIDTKNFSKLRFYDKNGYPFKSIEDTLNTTVLALIEFKLIR